MPRRVGKKMPKARKKGRSTPRGLNPKRVRRRRNGTKTKTFKY